MFKRLIVTLFLGILISLSAGCAVNPVTGRTQLMLVSESQDIEIGRSYAPEVEREMGGRIADEQLQNYVNFVGQKTAAVSHSPNWDYHFVALQDDSLNAFALPGGYIFITRGMLKALSTESQLASVLAHEVVHVVARHSSAAISKQIGVDMALSAVMSEKTPQSVALVTNLTRQILDLKFSRDDEKEADLAGMDYMVGAGYDPRGMIETMQILHEQQKSRPIDFLSTHPSPENRIGYLKTRVQTAYPIITGLKRGNEDYQKFVLDKLKN